MGTQNMGRRFRYVSEAVRVAGSRGVNAKSRDTHTLLAAGVGSSFDFAFSSLEWTLACIGVSVG